jgi:hypothetical protein
MFDMHFLSRLVAVGLLFLVTASSLGCGGKSVESYKPSVVKARQAIEAALSTWKDGAKHGPITSGSPALNVFDARWQSGAQLERFEILEELKDQEHPRFKVKLKLANKPEEVNEYLVVGIDPLLVFRDTDYKKASGL